ncbi:unnamed protein product, partial [Polarella glacialis]
GTQVTLQIPDGAPPGTLLVVPVRNGAEQIKVRVPEGCGPGSSLILTQAEGSEEWSMEIGKVVPWVDDEEAEDEEGEEGGEDHFSPNGQEPQQQQPQPQQEGEEEDGSSSANRSQEPATRPGESERLESERQQRLEQEYQQQQQQQQEHQRQQEQQQQQQHRQKDEQHRQQLQHQLQKEEQMRLEEEMREEDARMQAEAVDPSCRGERGFEAVEPFREELDAAVAFTVRLDTTAGVIDIIVRPDWAPHGTRRFLELAAAGDLVDLAFYRAISGCIVQFGLPAKRTWPPIPDDPPTGVPFLLGAVSFAAVGENTRRSTLFICVGDMSHCLGEKPWETPIGAVAESSLDVLEHIVTDFGDIAEFGGAGPDTSCLNAEGNAYLAREFPHLSYIRSATPLDWEGDGEELSPH